MSATRTPLRRVHGDGMLGGVCAAVGRHLGVDPLLLRVGFVVAAAAGGAGLVVYAIAWAAIPAEQTAAAPGRRLAAGDGSWRVGAGIGLLVLSALLLLRALGVWFSDVLVWPLALATSGAAVIWRQSLRGDASAARPKRRERAGAGHALPGGMTFAAAARPGALLGAALVVGGGLVFLWLNDALEPARDVVLAVVVVLLAAGLILAPWWLRLVRGLSAERTARIRSQERAEVAAHLHDSVLQTLALMQRRADDPRAVATLARRQERELRAWLNRARAPGSGATLAAALERAAAEVEDAHGVTVEVVTVGDEPLDARGEAIAAAAREALVNAAKFAAGAPIAVYAEITPARLQVFVRDRGPGFDLDAIPPDRRGVRESIIGRMERHGGRAVLSSDEGTEVELVMGR